MVGTRRGRPKKYWRVMISQDMTHLQVTKDMTTLNRRVRRTCIRVEGWSGRNTVLLVEGLGWLGFIVVLVTVL